MIYIYDMGRIAHAHLCTSSPTLAQLCPQRRAEGRNFEINCFKAMSAFLYIPRSPPGNIFIKNKIIVKP